MFLYVALAAIGLVAATWLLWGPSRSNYPPGPKGMPFIGIAWKVDPNKMHETFTSWAEEYGDVFSVKIYGMNYVVLNSFETIYDALVKRTDIFGGRRWTFRHQVVFKSSNDTIFGPVSKKWQMLKNVMIQTLKMYGNNLAHLETLSLELIGEKLEELGEIAKSGKAVDIKPMLNEHLASTMSSILFGRKMSKSSVAKILEVNEEGMKAIGHSRKGMLLDKFPWMRFFPLRGEYQRLCRISDNLVNTIKKEVAQSKERYIPGSPCCFTEGLFEYQRKHKDGPDDLEVTDFDCVLLNNDAIVGGTVTSLQTLSAALAILVNHPQIQNKMVEEIKQVIGERMPRLADRESMHYCEAVVCEVLRYHSMNPFLLLHSVTKDVDIQGCQIPEGTVVMFNMWNMNHDPKFWEDPWEFKPERFLDEDGKLLPSDHPKQLRMMQYGRGRRVCPGEVLGKNRLFLIVASFLQNFEFLPESEEKRPLHDPRTYDGGINTWPQHYKVVIKPRN